MLFISPLSLTGEGVGGEVGAGFDWIPSKDPPYPQPLSLIRERGLILKSFGYRGYSAMTDPVRLPHATLQQERHVFLVGAFNVFDKPTTQ